MSVTFSVIVPTPDGHEIEGLYASLVPQLGADDEVILVADTFSDTFEDIIRHCADVTQGGIIDDPRWRIAGCRRHDGHDWGHTQLNFGVLLASKSHLTFQDDDDTYAPDALPQMRHRIESTIPYAPHIFRTQYARWGTLPRTLDRSGVRRSAIGGHSLVIPNLRERIFFRPGKTYDGDFDMIEGTLRLWETAGIAPVYHDLVIAHAR